MKKLTKGTYTCPLASTNFVVFKVQYDNGVYVKLKGAFVLKSQGGIVESGSYKLYYDKITHWQFVTK